MLRASALSSICGGRLATASSGQLSLPGRLLVPLDSVYVLLNLGIHGLVGQIDYYASDLTEGKGSERREGLPGGERDYVDRNFGPVWNGLNAPEHPVSASVGASSNVPTRSCVRGAQTMSILPGGLSRARVAKKGCLGGPR